MQTGMLPDQMVLDNNDEVWYDEAEEVDVAVDLDGTAFPLRLGKNLQGVPLPLSCLCITMPPSHKSTLLPVNSRLPLTVCQDARKSSSVALLLILSVWVQC